MEFRPPKKGKRRKLSGQEKPSTFGFFDVLATGVGSSLAIGISVVIGGVIKNVTGPAFVVSVSLAGITALLGGLCFSEFGVKFLKADSAYTYSYFWSRENTAFIFGWALVLEYIAGSASAAKGIITFIDALTNNEISNFLKSVASTDFLNIFPYFDFISLAVVVVVTILISFGIKNNLALSKFLTVCNVAVILSVIIAGAFKADARNWQDEENTEEKSSFAPFGLLGITKGAAIIFYGFIGFDTVSVLGCDIKKRKRNLPLAISATILITLVAHVGMGVILTLMLPYNKLSQHAAVPSAFEEVGWNVLKWLVTVVSFSGFQTSLFGAMVPLPGIINTMANDGLLFRLLASSNLKFKTPDVASITGGMLAAVAAGVFPFRILVSLTVIGALFVYTILAINILLLRYSPKHEDFDEISESPGNLSVINAEVSIKAILENYFNFREKQPTNLTKKITQGNLILFCISSIGLSIIFNVFYDPLVKCTPEAVVPAGILLCIIFFNLISMTCQPKSGDIGTFMVPVIPFLPCLSIHLNIFLMLSLEPLIWLLFLSFMALGILPHLIWRFLKCSKGEVNKNSLYEINRTNALKLNESILKIKLEKKSFYEGTINLAFSDDFDDESNKVRIDENVKKQDEKTRLQLKQAEVIQNAELVPEEKAEPLENELELKFISVNSEGVVNSLSDEDEKVQWECVAEIHIEETFPQEGVALEIVDRTYNFLTEVDEELLKDEVNFEKSPDFIPTSIKFGDEPVSTKTNTWPNVEKSQQPSRLSDGWQSMEQHRENPDSERVKESNQELFKEELLLKIGTRSNGQTSEEINRKNKPADGSEISKLTDLKETGKEVFEEYNNVVEDSENRESKFSLDENNHQIVSLIVETFYEAHKSEMISNPNNVNLNDSKPISDEQNKIKEFKEKLNQLLKNQINGGVTVTKNLLLKSENTVQTEKNKEENATRDNIKTLNKSQIKGKLELLFAKGPPKRPLLGNSFNIKMNEADTDDGKGDAKDTAPSGKNDTNSNDNEKEKFVKASITLQDSIREKLLTLKSVTSEVSSDIYC